MTTKKFDWQNFAQSLLFAIAGFTSTYPFSQADFSWVSYLTALGIFAANYALSYFSKKTGVRDATATIVAANPDTVVNVPDTVVTLGPPKV